MTLHVVHCITRMIIGGAQENTLHTVQGQADDYGDRVTLITGPSVGPEGSLLDGVSVTNWKLQLLPELVRSVNPWKDWQSYRALVRLFRELKPDLIHTHASKAGILGRAAAATVGIPAVHTIHGAAFHYGQNRLAYHAYRRAEQWAGRRCERLISVSNAMTEQYLAAGIASPDRYITISSGMEVEPFRNPPRSPALVRAELGIDPDDIVVGKIARLFHLKGHEFLIQAASRVLRHNPRVRFLLVGDGILRSQIEAEIARRGMTDRFVFTGLVPPVRIPELINATDLVVHTSLWEGLARVLPQSLIAGKPVVSYDVDGARDVCLNDVTGYLVPPQSVDELADAILKLAGDAELRQRLGTKGRELFTDQFRHQTMTRRIREVYQEVLGSSSRK